MICDPPTIHCTSLSCKLSRAVKFKSFILKIQFFKRQLFFLFRLAWKSILIKFYLLFSLLACKIADLELCLLEILSGSELILTAFL